MLLIVGVIATGWGATTMAVPAANAQEETLVFCLRHRLPADGVPGRL